MEGRVAQLCSGVGSGNSYSNGHSLVDVVSQPVTWIMSSFPGRWLRFCSVVATLLLVACEEGVGPREQIITLEVAAARVPCVGVGPRECLQVRRSADDAWELFYESIEGFTYEAGFQYRLRVAERVIPNPPADGSSRAYRLVEVLMMLPAGSAGA